MSTKRKSNSELNKETKHFKSVLLKHDHKTDIEKLYGMVFPRGLFDFWDFCLSTNPDHPLDTLSMLNLKLVGPFYHMFAGTKPSVKDPQDFHMQWRYYFDTPEFLTLITSCDDANSLFHIGYLRDDPQTIDTCIVVSNSGKDAKYFVLGDSLFAAISGKLREQLKKVSGSQKEKLTSFQKSVESFSKKENFCLEANSALVKSRKKKVVTKSFHGAGIVVPIVNEIGYRPLHHTDDQLKKLLSKIVEAKDDEERMNAFEPLQQVVNFVQFANDECDYGMGLELGIDLFCNGSRYFYKMSKMLLTVAYGLLKWDLYSSICEAHLADRREDNFSRLDKK